MVCGSSGKKDKKKSDNGKWTSLEVKGEESPAFRKTGSAYGIACDANSEKGDSPLLKKNNGAKRDTSTARTVNGEGSSAIKKIDEMKGGNEEEKSEDPRENGVEMETGKETTHKK